MKWYLGYLHVCKDCNAKWYSIFFQDQCIKCKSKEIKRIE
jgi:hypothetical protein